MNREVCLQLEQEFGKKVFETHIRTNIQLAKAQEAGQDIFEYDKNSHGAEDYGKLSVEFLAHINETPTTRSAETNVN